jgi:membrane protease YdiL (CAAX protease family)
MTDSVPPPDDRGASVPPPFAPVEGNAPQAIVGAPQPYGANVPGGLVMVPAGWTQLPPPPPPVESPTAYHRLYRTSPRYRWWRPLVAVLLFGVFALTALLALNIIWFVVAIALGQVTIDDLARPDFADWLVALLSDITNPLSLVMLLGSLAVLLPLVPLALLCAGIRPVGVSSSVAFRLRWRWMLWCAVPASVVTAVSIGLPWMVAPFTGETITPVEVDPALFALLAVIIVLLVPLQATAEEYVFRGLLLQVVGAWVKAWPLAVVIATILFTIGHTQYEIWGMLSVAVMGLGFAIVTLRTGGLEAAIALHVINNVAAFLVLTSGIQGTTQMGSEGSGPLAPLTQLVLTAAYVVWVDRMAAKQGIARRRDLTLEPVR